MTPILKEVKVKRTVFTFNKKPKDVKSYIDNCVNTGCSSILFKNPAIPTSFYNEGRAASEAIERAIGIHKQSPTKGNRSSILTKAKAGQVWLNKYSGKVEVISNDDANRNTREEAASNITNSFLTPQKLNNSKKGAPETPRITVNNIGTGKIYAKILNGVDYQPSQTTFIFVEVAAEATVQLINGVLKISMKKPGDIQVKTVAKKGKYIHLSEMNSGSHYEVYAYAQNGKNQFSALSQPSHVRG